MAAATSFLFSKMYKVCTYIGFITVLLSQTATAADGDVTLESGVEPHGKIDALYQNISKSFSDLSSKDISEIYTKDAFYLTPESPLITGIDDIGAEWEDWFSWMRAGKGTLTINFRIIAREVYGDALGYDIGYFTTIQQRPDGENQTYEGKFITVTQKQANGQWRFTADTYNMLKKE